MFSFDYVKDFDSEVAKQWRTSLEDREIIWS